MMRTHGSWLQYRSPLSSLFSTRFVAVEGSEVRGFSSDLTDALALFALGPLCETATGVIRGGLAGQAYAFYIQLGGGCGVTHVFAAHEPAVLKAWLSALIAAGATYVGVVDDLPATSDVMVGGYDEGPSSSKVGGGGGGDDESGSGDSGWTDAIVPPNAIQSVISSAMTMAVLVDIQSRKPRVKMVSRYFVLTPGTLSVYTSPRLPAKLVAQLDTREYNVGIKHFAEAAPNCIFLAPKDVTGTKAEGVVWANVSSADKQRAWVRALVAKGKTGQAQWDSIRDDVEGTLFYEYLLAPPPPEDAKIRPPSFHSQFADVNDERKQKAIQRALEAEAAAAASARPASGDHFVSEELLAAPASGGGGAKTKSPSLSKVARMNALASKVPLSVKEQAARTRKWCQAVLAKRHPSGNTPIGQFNMEKAAACGWLFFEMVTDYAHERAPEHTIDVNSIAACRTNLSLAREWMSLLGIDVEGWQVDDVVGCSTRPILRALSAVADRYNVDLADGGPEYLARAIVPQASGGASGSGRASSNSGSSSGSGKKRALRSSYVADVQRAVPGQARRLSVSAPSTDTAVAVTVDEPFGWEPSLSSQQVASASKLEGITLPWINAVLNSRGDC
ncbi:uncharacterized protein AMSG_05354 [Thecamonas trahens ATCC 50062]|uniref:Calponin-homology (CH) domain-containing protein n=1 Tax=Thecamonas trahens ATCC 50062 TaxID=461836 RepID=A0A0L0DAU3_THETB|nr:hypothetical protein AMSG_05354 [Thecamonas trahens ATCC 50062]KNC49355.1 hypothetical protein AMSG_05354 [Thecamonas trahens ATCC 50062]|eukprot:XP_013757781.1 hypothetical protein AMSG_05354 [Thecamonas trahens ATCC 50062]